MALWRCKRCRKKKPTSSIEFIGKAWAPVCVACLRDERIAKSERKLGKNAPSLT